MSKKSTKGIYLICIIIFVSILLICTDVYFSGIREERFYQRTEDSYQQCLQKAKQDNVPARWCDEINSASIRTYSLAKSSGRNSYSLFVFMLTGILIAFISLKNQVEELKEKINV